MNDTASPVRGAHSHESNSRAYELASIFRCASIDDPVPGPPPDPLPDPVRTLARDLADDDTAPPHLRFGSLRIRAYADGSWEPDERGPRAVVLNVPDACDEPLDLIAWLPDRPERWWRRTRLAAVLGARSAEGAGFLKTPLTVHSNPERWLFSRRRGVCVLDWSAELRLWFDGIDTLVADSEALAHRLNAALGRRAARALLTRYPTDPTRRGGDERR